VSRLKILTVVGARPQFVKAAPMQAAMQQHGGIAHVLVHTGQHYDYAMSKVFFDELALPSPDYHLEVGSGAHGAQTARIMERVEPILEKERPDWVLVYGDTNSTLAAALAASKLHLPVAHVEAGLRSFNKAMPEEINRIVTDHVSSILFCPTVVAMDNLKREGFALDEITTPTVDAPLVVNAGDVMYDAALLGMDIALKKSTILQSLELSRGSYFLATIHRAENTDDRDALALLLDALAHSNATVVLPLHPRTAERFSRFGLNPGVNIRVIPPVGYFDMLMLEKSARAILTDSGGVQKEAFFFQVPCVTLRRETEWVETVETGWNRLAGSDAATIGEIIQTLGPGKMDVFPYGDGNAAQRIVGYLVP
jgi:UDP-GlcNAc3NAcA epimerase